MPASTDFLPFATGSGANVESQAAYLADSTTAVGFSAGVAASNKFNKAMRQSSFIAAGIANFVANVLGINVPDDGNLAAFITNYQAALAASVAGVIPSLAAYATTASVQAAILNNGPNFAAATGTANALAITLAPVPSALVVGMEVIVKVTAANTGAATIAVNTLAATSIIFNGVALKANMLKVGRIYQMVYDGAAFNLITPQFDGIVSSSYGASGWEIWSNGKIEQWASATSSFTGSTTASVTWPMAFPTACLFVIVSANGTNSTGGGISASLTAQSTTGASAKLDSIANTGTVGAGFNARAIGN